MAAEGILATPSSFKDRDQVEYGIFYHTNSPKRGKEILIKSDVLDFMN